MAPQYLYVPSTRWKWILGIERAPLLPNGRNGENKNKAKTSYVAQQNQSTCFRDI